MEETLEPGNRSTGAEKHDQIIDYRNRVCKFFLRRTSWRRSRAQQKISRHQIKLVYLLMNIKYITTSTPLFFSNNHSLDKV